MDRFQALQGRSVAAAQTLEDLQVHRQRVEGPTEIVQQAIQMKVQTKTIEIAELGVTVDVVVT